MAESKIIITGGDDPSSWDMDVRNVSIVYLPKLLGSLLKQGIENVKFNPADERLIPDIKIGAAMEVLQGLGINLFAWHSIKDEVPDPNIGPYIGIVDSNPNQIFAGLKFDPEKKVMISESDSAMNFLTHWFYMPSLPQTQQQEITVTEDVPPFPDEEDQENIDKLLNKSEE